MGLVYDSDYFYSQRDEMSYYSQQQAQMLYHLDQLLNAIGVHIRWRYRRVNRPGFHIEDEWHIGPGL